MSQNCRENTLSRPLSGILGLQASGYWRQAAGKGLNLCCKEMGRGHGCRSHCRKGPQCAFRVLDFLISSTCYMTEVRYILSFFRKK